MATRTRSRNSGGGAGGGAGAVAARRKAASYRQKRGRGDQDSDAEDDSGQSSDSAAAAVPSPNTAMDIKARREANLQRNRAMLAALNLPTLSGALKQTTKRATPVPKGHKKQRTATGPRRTSKRVRGINPDGSVGTPVGPPMQLYVAPPPREHIRPEGTLSVQDAAADEHDVPVGQRFLAQMSHLDNTAATTTTSRSSWKKYDNFSIHENHVVKAVPHRVFSLVVHPDPSSMVVAVGDKWGHVALWQPLKAKEHMDLKAVADFAPHARPVAGIAFDLDDGNSLLSCSYDGSVRCLDVVKQQFLEDYVDEDELFTGLSLSRHSRTMAVSTRAGDVLLIDRRTKARKVATYELHERKISQVQFHPGNGNYLATCSTDSRACIWDVRKMKPKSSKAVGVLQHGASVTGVSFSSNGTSLVTTSNDNSVRIYHGAPKCKSDCVRIKHNNHTGRWLTPFKAFFDPANDGVVCIGNMKRAVDVFDAKTGAPRGTMTSENLTAVPTLSAWHPSRPMLASSTASGRLYLWQR